MNLDTDLQSQDADSPTADATTIEQEDDTSENEEPSIPGNGTDSSEAPEEKSLNVVILYEQRGICFNRPWQKTGGLQQRAI